MTFYTKYGDLIRYPEAYAKTGAPMYEKNSSKNINTKTYIYKINCDDGKKYIGKTNNVDRRMKQHANGNGAKVTHKFKPKTYQIIDEVPGYFSDRVEQHHTDKNIQKYGYQNVRGGKYTNSKTLHKNNYKYSNQYYSDYDDESSEDEEKDYASELNVAEYIAEWLNPLAAHAENWLRCNIFSDYEDY